MRPPPPLAALPRYPVAGGVALLAAGVTVARLVGDVNLEPLYVNEQVQRGELWRFVTSILPHGSPLHLMFNLYWLWVFGTLIEGILGHGRTVALIAFLALGSSAAQYGIEGSGIGLSGVVYGLWGMLMILEPRDRRFRDATDQNTNVLMAGWFVLCIVLTYAGVLRIANVAHGMGAVLGIVVGLGMAVRPRVAWWALAAVLTALSLLTALRLRPWVNFSKEAKDEFQLGYDAFEAGREAEAEKWYRRAVRIDPSDHRAWFNLGLTYVKMQRLPDAAESFHRAAALNRGDKKYVEAEEDFAAYRGGANAPPPPAADGGDSPATRATETPR